MSLCQRYQILQPMETGPGVSVYACRERSPDSVERVLSLLPQGRDEKRFEDVFLTRKELVSPFLVRVRDLAYRGRRIGVVSDRIPGDYAPGAFDHVSDKKRFAFDLVRLFHWLFRKGLYLGVVAPHHLFIRNDGQWVANFLGPRSLFRRESRGSKFLSHAAPEYIEAKQENPEADLYSLGLLLYELFVGQPAFTSENASDLAAKQQLTVPTQPRHLERTVPKAIDELILGLLEKQASARPDLEHALTVLNPDEIEPKWIPHQLRAPLVGRDSDLERYQKTLEEYLLSPKFLFLSICGPSGIGKTRLASEFEALARVKGLESLRVSCFQDGKPLTLLREISSLTGTDQESTEPEQVARRLAAKLRTESTGWLVVGDDLHWLDEGDKELLRWFVILDLPIMVISTARPEEANKSWKQLCSFLQLEGRISQLELGSLNPETSGDLLSSLSPLPLRPHDLKTIASRSLGSPYYLIESLRFHLQNDGRSAHPPSLQESLIARINQRSEVEKHILDTLAVAATPLSIDALRRITKQQSEKFERAVEQLQARELIQAEGSIPDLTLRLTHDWVGVTVLSDLSVEEKRLIHAAIAGFTESDGSGSRDQWKAVSLARNWLNSDTPELAGPYLRPAIEALASHSLFDAAAQIRLQALRLSVDRGWAALKETLQFLHQCGELNTIQELVNQELSNPVRLSNRRKRWLYRFLGRAAMLRGSWDLAIESTTRARKTRVRDRTSKESLLKADLLLSFSVAGREAAATQLFEEIHVITPSSDEERSKFGLARYSYHLHVTGQVDRACSCMLESLRVTDTNRLSPRLIGRLTNLWIARCTVGEWLSARKTARYCSQEARMFRNPDLSILQASNLATFRRKLGETRRSLETVGTVAPIIESPTAFPLWLDHFALEKAKNLAYLLLLDEAVQQLSSETSESAHWKMEKYSTRAWVWLLLGRPLRALASVPASSDPRHLLVRAQRQMARAQAYLQLGQLTRARAEALKALLTLPDYLTYPRTKAHQQLGLVCLAEGRLQEALEHFEISLQTAREQFFYPLMARGYGLKGKCLALLGDPRRGRVFAARALQVMTRVERPGFLAEIYRILGQILAQLNRHEESRLNFVRALRILREKSLLLSDKHRPKFDDLWIAPIEKELARLARSRRTRLSSLQAVERFAARSSTSANIRELGQEMVQAITLAVSQSSASLRKVHANGRTSTIAEKHAAGWSPRLSSEAETSVSKRCSLQEAFSLLEIGRLDLRVTSQSGGFSESEYDLIKSLIRIMEALREDWSERTPEKPGPGQGTHLQLLDGRVIVGRHPEMLQVFSLIRKIGPTGATVLIQGESGTGKELIARALHDLSSRATDTWVALNCAAFPPDLIESELFGYRKGSFTGAGEDRSGLVEAADGGTLFLDEIASMPLEHQSRLLRVLQEKTVRRLGESDERPVDVRIIAATNQSLDVLVERGEFREDLFHRLNVIQIVVPPLRERASDIPILAGHFLKELEKRHGEAKEATPGFLERLEGLRFRGNVRELHNVVEQAYLLSPEKQLRAVDITIPNGDKLTEEKVNGRSQRLFQGLVRGEVEFWPDIRERFLARDLSRLEVRGIISLGLASTDGSYRQLVRKFHLPEKDYRRFLAFLSHHKCKVDFRPFRNQY